jgi:hypothetical protein
MKARIPVAAGYGDPERHLRHQATPLKGSGRAVRPIGGEHTRLELKALKAMRENAMLEAA